MTGALPTGTLTFKEGLTTLGTATLTDGSGAFTTSSLALGGHIIKVDYSGDTQNNSASAVTLVNVIDGTPMVSILPGFALIASYSTSSDVNLPPSASLNVVPDTTTAGTSVYLLWSTTNIAKIRITGTEFDTGFINTTGSGMYTVKDGFSQSITLTLTGYDVQGNVLKTATAQVTIN